MADQKYSDATAKAKAEQKAKLAEQLRANLRRRKTHGVPWERLRMLTRGTW